MVGNILADHAMLCLDSALGENFGAPASLCDLTGQRLIVSDLYAAILMRSKDDLLSVPWQTLVHPDDFKDLSAPFDRMIARGEPYERRCRILRGDGAWLPLSFRITPRDRNGERILYQANIAVTKLPVEKQVSQAVPDTYDVISFIRDMAQQLGGMAARRRKIMLQHLLALASAEAEQELAQLSEEIRSHAAERPELVH